jgi:hypothetical protein
VEQTYPACAGDGRIGVPLNDPVTAWADYQVGLYTTPWTDQNYAQVAVRTERRLELAMEGQRFFDLRRWGTAEHVINAYLAEEATRRPYLTAAAPFASRHYRYPIPPIQIDLSKVGETSMLQQNAGW